VGQWVKGVSGNPRGRLPIGQELTPTIRALLRAKDPATGVRNKKLIALALVAKAIDGDLEAVRIVLERVDGKVPTPVEHSGPDGGSIPLVFDYGAAVAELALTRPAPGPDGHRLPSGPPEGGRDGAPLGEDPDGG
jgi:Family of unknown function (DUF5681)